METQTWLSRHNKFISTVHSVSSDDFLHAFLEVADKSLQQWICILINLQYTQVGYDLSPKGTFSSINTNINSQKQMINIIKYWIQTLIL